MLEESIIARLESLRLRSTEIHQALVKEDATDDMAHFTQLNKEYSEIAPIVNLFKSLQDTETELNGAKELLDSGDSELIELAKIEVSNNQEKIAELEKKLNKKQTIKRVIDEKITEVLENIEENKDSESVDKEGTDMVKDIYEK